MTKTPKTPKATKLAFASAKGGVGKTTVAVNVAGALSARDNDVLLVDLDPQGVATEALGFVAEYDAEPPTLLDTLVDSDYHDRADDLVVEHDEMDVLPSNIDLLHAERELAVADMIAKLRNDEDEDDGFDPDVLAQFTVALNPADVGDHAHANHLVDDLLEQFNSAYDFIVIDTPPFYGMILNNALFAARNVVIPALAEGTSQRAVELLFGQLGALEDETGIALDDVACIANRVDKRTNEATAMLDWFEEAFGDVPVHEIPNRVALQYAYDAGSSIVEYRPESDVADIFRTIAEDIDERVRGASA